MKREAMLSLYSEEPLYGEAEALELLMMVGPPERASDIAEAAAFSLSELGKSFAFDLWRESQASTPQREKGAKSLADACGKVLRIAGVADGGELLPMFGAGGLFAAANLRGEARGEAAVMNALHAVAMLQADALKMLEIEGKRRRMNPPSAGRPESKALQKLICELSCLYERLWERAPGFSNGGEPEPCGPLLRLISDVCKRLNKRGVKFPYSRSSLRAHWRRIPDAEKMPETELFRQASAIDAASSSLSE